MTHAIRYLFIGIKRKDEPIREFPKPRVCIHRPTDAGATYLWVRMDGAPVTDKDMWEVDRCDECYPVKKDEFTDNRKMA